MIVGYIDDLWYVKCLFVFVMLVGMLGWVVGLVLFLVFGGEECYGESFVFRGWVEVDCLGDDEENL